MRSIGALTQSAIRVVSTDELSVGSSRRRRRVSAAGIPLCFSSDGLLFAVAEGVRVSVYRRTPTIERIFCYLMDTEATNMHNLAFVNSNTGIIVSLFDKGGIHVINDFGTVRQSVQRMTNGVSACLEMDVARLANVVAAGFMNGAVLFTDPRRHMTLRETIHVSPAGIGCITLTEDASTCAVCTDRSCCILIKVGLLENTPSVPMREVCHGDAFATRMHQCWLLDQVI